MRHIDELDAAHAAACIVTSDACVRFTRSRSAKNRAALIAAEAASEATAAACVAERNRLDAEAIAERRAARLAAVAERRAKAARQLELFA